MTENHLKLNDAKTEFLVLGKKSVLKKVRHITEITVGETKAHKVEYAHNIGAVLDSELKMTAHVSSIVRSCNCHLRQISHICPYLTQNAAATLVNSVITSRLDYVNSLLFGVPDNLVSKYRMADIAD